MGCAANNAGYTNKMPFLRPTVWACHHTALVPLLSQSDCIPHHMHNYKSAQTKQYRTLQDANFGVAVLSSTYANDPLNICRHEWEFHAHPHETIFVNPRLTRTLKQSKFVNPDVAGDVEEYEFLRVSEVGMNEAEYDSRKFCTNNK